MQECSPVHQYSQNTAKQTSTEEGNSNNNQFFTVHHTRKEKETLMNQALLTDPRSELWLEPTEEQSVNQRSANCGRSCSSMLSATASYELEPRLHRWSDCRMAGLPADRMWRRRRVEAAFDGPVDASVNRLPFRRHYLTKSRTRQRFYIQLIFSDVSHS